MRLLIFLKKVREKINTALDEKIAQQQAEEERQFYQELSDNGCDVEKLNPAQIANLRALFLRFKRSEYLICASSYGVNRTIFTSDAYAAHNEFLAAIPKNVVEPVVISVEATKTFSQR